MCGSFFSPPKVQSPPPVQTPVEAVAARDDAAKVEAESERQRRASAQGDRSMMSSRTGYNGVVSAAADTLLANPTQKL